MEVDKQIMIIKLQLDLDVYRLENSKMFQKKKNEKQRMKSQINDKKNRKDEKKN